MYTGEVGGNQDEKSQVMKKEAILLPIVKLFGFKFIKPPVLVFELSQC
jgi:hypothetical protein